MEYVDGDMDLYQLWNDSTKIPENAIRIYAAEIATALDYLRSKQVVYRGGLIPRSSQLFKFFRFKDGKHSVKPTKTHQIN